MQQAVGGCRGSPELLKAIKHFLYISNTIKTTVSLSKAIKRFPCNDTHRKKWFTSQQPSLCSRRPVLRVFLYADDDIRLLVVRGE